MKKSAVRSMPRIIAALLAGALLLLFAFALCGCGERRKSYEAGVAAYEAHDYYGARDYFTAADGYMRSQEYLDAIAEYERLYLLGVDNLNNKQYEQARSLFSAIAEFGNSSEYVDYIDELKSFYDDGVSLYSEGDYVAARERFVQSCEYGAAGDYIASIDKMEEFYQAAMALYNEHRYQEAIDVFEGIGVNYRDTYDKLTELYGLLERKSILLTSYMEAYLKSHAEGGDAITFPLTDINDTGFMISDSDNVLFIGNTDGFGYIVSISFWISTAIVDELGDEGVHALLAHCIRALNIDMMSYDDTLLGMDDYLSGAATYGNFRFELTHDESGFIILTAVYIYGD